MSPRLAFSLRLTRILLSTLLFSSILTSRVHSACASESPENVLVCWERVFADRDSTAFRELLADEPTILRHRKGVKEAEPVDFQTFVTPYLFVLRDPNIRKLSFMAQKTDAFLQTRGERFNTWRLDGIELQLSYQIADAKGQLRDVTSAKRVSWVLRRHSDPSPHFDILTWEEWEFGAPEVGGIQ